MSHLDPEIRRRAQELIALYPEPRSALIPVCHLAQEQDGWLRPEAMEEIAQLVGVTPAEVRGTASFYDMLHTEPVGTYVVAVCTNIACLLRGADTLLEHAEQSLGVRAGGTTEDGAITLEEAECLADCGRAPCVQVNHRYMGAQSPESFDRLVADLRAGALEDTVPRHGTLVRVHRSVGLAADREQVAAERARMAAAQEARAAAAQADQAAQAGAGQSGGSGAGGTGGGS